MASLLDTNVISELRKKSNCDPNVFAWQAKALGTGLFVSVISLMEIRRGVLMARRKNAAFAELLEGWYETQVKPAFDGCILPIDLAISERCSAIVSVRTRNLADALIAATAYVYNLTLVTRNVADFADCEVKLVNPWE
jgi:predicted nucleic acid-binding protein